MEDCMRIAFLGLGSMGRPMALNLARSEHDVVVWNRTRDRAEGLEGVTVAESPRQAAEGVAVAITMLSGDDAADSVCFGDDGLLEGLPAGAVHAAMSTLSADSSRKLAESHEGRGQGYVAAPVFGRPQAAEGASLWIVVGGRKEAIDACRPAFDLLGQGIIEAGEEPAQANVMKLAGNFMLACAIESMAEAYTLVRAHQIPVGLFHEVMASRLFGSPIYEGYGGLIAAGRYEPAGFKLAHGLKDTRYALAAGEGRNVPLPLGSLIHDRLLSAVARGWADIDWAGLGRVAAEDAGMGAD
jgi:3-hydroxyisobutyrate dehydrogenase-like beta-hydroxyacid dehydrogenase